MCRYEAEDMDSPILQGRHIGDNGNWFIGKEDTGIGARGNEYTGGAHGIYMTTYLNMDLTLMRPLRLDDIFVAWT